MASAEDTTFTNLAAMVANDPKYSRTVWNMISEYGRAVLGSLGLFQHTSDRAMKILASPQSVASERAMETLSNTQNVLSRGVAANDSKLLPADSVIPNNLADGSTVQIAVPLKKAA